MEWKRTAWPPRDPGANWAQSRLHACLRRAWAGGQAIVCFCRAGPWRETCPLIMNQGIFPPNGNSSAGKSYSSCFISICSRSRIRGFGYSELSLRGHSWVASDHLHSLARSCVHPSFHSFIALFLSFSTSAAFVRPQCVAPQCLPGPPVWPASR